VSTTADEPAPIPWQNGTVTAMTVRARGQVVSPGVAAMTGPPSRPVLHAAAHRARRVPGEPVLLDRLSPLDVGEIELTVECLTDGEVSPFMHDVVEVGDELELRGPLTEYFT